jgi:hypothetical protein
MITISSNEASVRGRRHYHFLALQISVLISFFVASVLGGCTRTATDYPSPKLDLSDFDQIFAAALIFPKWEKTHLRPVQNISPDELSEILQSNNLGYTFTSKKVDDVWVITHHHTTQNFYLKIHLGGEKLQLDVRMPDGSWSPENMKSTNQMLNYKDSVYREGNL